MAVVLTGGQGELDTTRNWVKFLMETILDLGVLTGTVKAPHICT